MAEGLDEAFCNFGRFCQGEGRCGWDTVSLSHIFGHDSAAIGTVFDAILYQSSEEKTFGLKWFQMHKLELSYSATGARQRRRCRMKMMARILPRETSGPEKIKQIWETIQLTRLSWHFDCNIQDAHSYLAARDSVPRVLEMDSSNLWHLCHRSEACAGFVNIHGWQGTALNSGLATTADWVPTSGEHEKSVGSSANVALPKWRVSPKWWSFRECSVPSHCFLCWGDVLQCFTHIAKEFWKSQS